LAAGHIEELSKPTYSTCIGLILKGYDDYEHNRKDFEKGYRQVQVPDGLRRGQNAVTPEILEAEGVSEDQMKKRRNLTGFWSKFKDRIIDLFKEEEDKHLG
jgi:cell division protein FtsA